MIYLKMRREKSFVMIFLYFKEVILKYKDRFLDFDAVTFIPLLEERFEDIKNGKLVSKRKYDSY